MKIEKIGTSQLKNLNEHTEIIMEIVQGRFSS